MPGMKLWREAPGVAKTLAVAALLLLVVARLLEKADSASSDAVLGFALGLALANALWSERERRRRDRSAGS